MIAAVVNEDSEIAIAETTSWQEAGAFRSSLETAANFFSGDLTNVFGRELHNGWQFIFSRKVAGGLGANCETRPSIAYLI